MSWHTDSSGSYCRSHWSVPPGHPLGSSLSSLQGTASACLLLGVMGSAWLLPSPEKWAGLGLAPSLFPTNVWAPPCPTPCSLRAPVFGAFSPSAWMGQLQVSGGCLNRAGWGHRSQPREGLRVSMGRLPKHLGSTGPHGPQGAGTEPGGAAGEGESAERVIQPISEQTAILGAPPPRRAVDFP